MKGNFKMLTEIDQIICQEIDLQGPGVAVAIVKDDYRQADYLK
jgi:hypothetical protein